MLLGESYDAFVSPSTRKVFEDAEYWSQRIRVNDRFIKELGNLPSIVAANSRRIETEVSALIGILAGNTLQYQNVPQVERSRRLTIPPETRNFGYDAHAEGCD